MFMGDFDTLGENTG